MLPSSYVASALLGALRLTGGSIGQASTVAQRLGIRNRFTLTRLLRREGLPPLRELSRWAKVLAWFKEWERSGESLCSQAARAGADPAVYYRHVLRTTGMHWTEIQRVGLEGLPFRFLDLKERRCQIQAWDRILMFDLSMTFPAGQPERGAEERRRHQNTIKAVP